MGSEVDPEHFSHSDLQHSLKVKLTFSSLNMSTSTRVSKWLFYLLLFPAVLGVCGWQGWQWWSWASAPVLSSVTTEANPEAAAVTLEIPSGTTANQIGQDLEALGLIHSSFAWDLWTRWQSLWDRGGSFQAGTYELSPAEPMLAIGTKIWEGDVTTQSFTIPEGWSIQQMADFFAEQGLFSAEEFIAASQVVPRDRYPWLPAGLSKLEGFLYPDTYELSEATSPEVIIDQMLTRFEQVALPLYEKGQTAYTLQEWVTLASIVEKEAVINEERPRIAGVFAKRLKEGMPLGADPTVEYGLGIRQTVEQPLTWAQVETPSPYNTYINVGLPPTPIASPGLASLQASLKPEETDYLYFVARYDGTHIFSRTLAEHEAAKAAIDEELASQPNATTESAN
jgi:UPF0755 protein